MTREWRTLPLGEFMTFQRGFDLPVKERSSGGIPVIGSTGPVGIHSEAKVAGPGVVIGRSGSIGGAQYLRGAFWPLNTTLWVKDFHGNDPRFCYYFLQTLDLAVHNSGSGVPTLNRNHIHPILVNVPVRRREQELISGILGALDDKIELNRRMSETLEQTARTLFWEWFVSPPDEPEMRQAWAIKPLDEIADFLNGAASQRYPPVEGEASLPVIKIRELNQGITEQSGRVTAAIPQKWHVEDGDVLFSWSGTLVAKKWTGGKAALNQHLFKVTSSTYPQWFFFQWILHHLDAFRGIAADKATTMGHIRRHHLSEAKCLIPDPATLKAMSNIMQPLHRRRLMCDLESRTLGELRDTLLPKLISGELRIPQAEQLVSEVV